MILKDVFDRFARKTPVCVMVRATIENVLSADRLDAVFDENAEQQYTGDLLFSTVADIMGLVVCQIHPSVNAAWNASIPASPRELARPSSLPEPSNMPGGEAKLRPGEFVTVLIQ